MKKIKAAIIGTGNIGTDLMFKILRSEFIELVSFVGRREDSPGIQLARKNNVYTATIGIDFFKNHSNCCQLVFDATDAKTACRNYPIFKTLNISVIDLTPAKIGPMCIPSINGGIIKTNDNINMITCGGQASIPLLHLLSKRFKNLEYIEVVSQIASKSAGMATRINIDHYIETTEKAIQQFTKCNNCKVILNLNPAEPCVDMQTTMFIKTKDMDSEGILDELNNIIN